MKPISTPTFNLIANIYYSKRIWKYIHGAPSLMEGLSVLDAPCGNGSLIQCRKPSSYVGADIDIHRVMEAKRRNTLENFIISNASNLTFKNGKFDRILASGLFHHVDDLISHKILSEFSRVLASQRKLVVVEAI